MHFRTGNDLDLDQVIELYVSSTLGERRPVEERERMQVLVEKLHREWTPDREYLPPPARGKLAELDPAQLVTPPTGMEVGYGPIAVKQEGGE